jgi:predicted AAA+ superfamily ATPase
LNQLELLTRQKIILGETLLFLDEIQQCPKALQSLRYFKEQIPELHLIAAGSLLEFAIRDEDFSYPVGRVQFAKLFPLSFEEFLIGLGESSLQEALASFDTSNPPPPAIHTHLIQKVKDYFIIGGMPASVVTFLKTHSYLDVKYTQKALWDAYEADFGKYATKTQHRYLRKSSKKAQN